MPVGHLIRVAIDRPSRGVLLCLTGFASGLAESIVLVLVLRVAVGMTEASKDLSIHLGGLDMILTASSALWLAVLAAVGLLVTSAVSSWLSASIAAGVMKREREQTMAKFLRASWSSVADEPPGELQEALSVGVTQIGQASMALTQTAVALLNFIAMALAALVVQPLAAVVVMVMAGLMFVFLNPMTRYSRHQARAGVNANLQYATFVSETVRLVQEYLTFGVTPQITEIAADHARETVVPYRRGRFITRFMPGVYQTVAVLIAIGGLALANGQKDLDVAAVGAVVILLLRASSYSQSAQSSYHTMMELLPNAELVRGEFDKLEAGRRVPAPRPLDTFDHLELRSVGLRYPRRDQEAITGVSLRVDRGDALAIVGPSGAGKTTLLEVLLRLRAPTSGQFIVNGVDAAEFDEKDWTRVIAYVPQVPQLIVGTITENIAFFRDDIDTDRVVAAAKAAQVHDEIEQLPLGYDTIVGPRASGVSVGQRQRLGIARALAGQPMVLILDEPTSALDSVSEQRLRHALSLLVGSTTMILVSHREATTSVCQKLARMTSGHLAEPEPVLEPVESDLVTSHDEPPRTR